jgi:hypothetical protein
MTDRSEFREDTMTQLHDAFDKDDAVAAEEFRLSVARTMIESLRMNAGTEEVRVTASAAIGEQVRLDLFPPSYERSFKRLWAGLQYAFGFRPSCGALNMLFMSRDMAKMLAVQLLQAAEA